MSKPLPKLTYAEREAVARLIRGQLKKPFGSLRSDFRLTDEEADEMRALLKSAADKLEDGL